MVRKKEAAWKEVLKASDEGAKERCIEAYREEKYLRRTLPDYNWLGNKMKHVTERIDGVVEQIYWNNANIWWDEWEKTHQEKI